MYILVEHVSFRTRLCAFVAVWPVVNLALRPAPQLLLLLLLLLDLSVHAAPRWLNASNVTHTHSWFAYCSPQQPYMATCVASQGAAKQSESL